MECDCDCDCGCGCCCSDLKHCFKCCGFQPERALVIFRLCVIGIIMSGVAAALLIYDNSSSKSDIILLTAFLFWTTLNCFIAICGVYNISRSVLKFQVGNLILNCIAYTVALNIVYQSLGPIGVLLFIASFIQLTAIGLILQHINEIKGEAKNGTKKKKKETKNKKKKTKETGVMIGGGGGVNFDPLRNGHPLLLPLTDEENQMSLARGV